MEKYEWSPANDPPDSRRFVEVWFSREKWGAQHGVGHYVNQEWSTYPQAPRFITHWRDVTPPEERIT